MPLLTESSPIADLALQELLNSLANTLSAKKLAISNTPFSPKLERGLVNSWPNSLLVYSLNSGTMSQSF